MIKFVLFAIWGRMVLLYETSYSFWKLGLNFFCLWLLVLKAGYFCFFRPAFVGSPLSLSLSPLVVCSCCSWIYCSPLSQGFQYWSHFMDFKSSFVRHYIYSLYQWALTRLKWCGRFSLASGHILYLMHVISVKCLSLTGWIRNQTWSSWNWVIDNIFF